MTVELLRRLLGKAVSDKKVFFNGKEVRAVKETETTVELSTDTSVGEEANNSAKTES